jgi:hypothetical protein
MNPRLDSFSLGIGEIPRLQLQAFLIIPIGKQRAAAAAAPVEPIPRMPLEEATVNHNFSILGDAEFQFAKTSGQHGTFLFADFAPVFLYRGGEKVLFEAGFDFGLQNNAPNSSGASTTINLSFAQLDYLINDYVRSQIPPHPAARPRRSKSHPSKKPI